MTTREGLVRRDTMHPATVQFVARRFGDYPELRRKAHNRVGDWYEMKIKTSPYIEDGLESGHHLFQAGEYDRAYDMLGSASDWLQQHGRVHESLQALEPFLTETVRGTMTPDRVGRLLGTVGIAYASLGQVDRAIGFYEQQLVIVREIGDRRGEGNALGNLGSAYANLGQVERAIGLLEQALRIGQEIKDPRMVRIFTPQLERLGGGGAAAEADEA